MSEGVKWEGFPARGALIAPVENVRNTSDFNIS